MCFLLSFGHIHLVPCVCVCVCVCVLKLHSRHFIRMNWEAWAIIFYSVNVYFLRWQSVFSLGWLSWRGYHIVSIYMKLNLDYRWVMILIISNLSLITLMPSIPNHMFFPCYSGWKKAGIDLSLFRFTFVFYFSRVLVSDFHESIQR